MPEDPPKKRSSFPEPRRDAPSVNAPPIARASIKVAPPVAAPTTASGAKGNTNLMFAIVGGAALVAAVVTWLVLREPRRAPAAASAASASSSPATPEKSVASAPPTMATVPATIDVKPLPRPNATASAVNALSAAANAACICLNDVDEGPVIRASCVQQLRENTSPEATACLRAFLDDPAAAKTLENMKSEDPTPEQEVILDVENAMRAKGRELKAKRAAGLAPIEPPGPPLDPPKLKPPPPSPDYKGPPQ